MPVALPYEVWVKGKPNVEYDVVSIESVPSEPLVLTKPFEVKFESLERLITFVPEKVLLFARRVEEAAVIVMSPEPLKEVPLMFLAVWRIVALPAFPLTAPVMIFEKVLLPEKVLLSERSEDEAAPESDVRKPASFVNQERLTEEEAIELTKPPEPM